MGKDKKKSVQERGDAVAKALSRASSLATGVATSSIPTTPITNRLLFPLLDRKLERFPIHSHGELIDPELLKRVEKIRKTINAPNIPLQKGVSHAFVAHPVHPYPKWITASHPNVAAIAHEMGHSIDSPIRTFSKATPRLIPAAFFAGMMSAFSDNETLQTLAPLFSASGLLPELLEEGRASAHALRGIAKAEGARSALQAAGRLAPAFGTYAAGAVPLALAPFVAKAVRDYMMKQRKGKEKTQKKEAAEQPKPVPLKTEGRLKASPSRAWATEGPKPKTSKPGKATSTKINLPSKRKFYRDMQRQMSPGRGQRLAVKEASIELLGGLLASTALIPLKNLLAHGAINTKASPGKIKAFFDSLGNDFLRAGFRHAMTGKKIKSSGVPGVAIGALGGAAPMAIYNQGYDYGRKIYKATKAAPYAGAATGAAQGYLSEKGEGVPFKEIAIGAALGTAAGVGGRRLTSLKSPDSKVGKILDRMAK